MTINKPQQERFKQMLKLREEGQTVIQIAAHFGITRQRVSQIFRYYDMPLRISVPNEVARTIPDPSRLSLLYGFKISSMRTRLTRMGFKFPRQPYTRSIWTEDRVMAMYRDYEAGMTQVQIAEKYGIHQTGVSRLFTDWGLKTTPRGWPKGKPRGKRQTE